MAYYDGYGQRPPLKNGVDMQLQSAFSEQNWTTVLRLADKRVKGSQDAYYEVVKVCAETKLDNVTDKAAAAVYVDALVRKGSVPKDIDAIELLEWACSEAQVHLDYTATFGVLRFRWVKANPRNVQAGITCLRECLLNWDLVNAQQIATVLDKSSNANDRRFMFWNILLTHMLAGSPQCADAKRKIYGMLAQKQLEKAAEPVEANGLSTSSNATAPTERSLRSEEEFLLYFRVLVAHGTPDNFQQRALNTNAGAVAQFAAGRKQLFCEVLTQLETAQRWDAVFGLCRDALGTTDGAGRPSTLACDLRIWNSFIAAAQQQADIEKAFDEVQVLLGHLVAADPQLPQMYAKTVSLALLQTAFALPTSLVPENDQGGRGKENNKTLLSLQVQQLLGFIEANIERASVFGDVKEFVEKLAFANAKDLVDSLAVEKPGRDETQRKVLLLKLRYLLATCPETRCPRMLLAEGSRNSPSSAPSDCLFELACKLCLHAAPESYGCTSCLQSLAMESLQLYRALSDSSEFMDSVGRRDKDPRVDLTLVAVSSLMRLSGIHHPATKTKPGRQWLAKVDVTHLLQAALVLDAQQRQTPDDIPVRLLLVRLSTLLGCAAQALQLSKPLGVKRTILDALGPLFYDRMSTVSPGLFTAGKPLLEPLRQYYDTVLWRPSAVKIWDAFEAGSYSSILDMAAFNENLQHSCTRVMTVVEERRAARSFGAKMEDARDLSIFTEITNGVALVNVTDYGSIPNFESSSGPCLAEVVAPGPALSNTRMHLGLLAERFLDLINFKSAKEYKPAKAGEAAARDKMFLIDSLAVVQHAIDDYLHQPAACNYLTHGELTYYTVISLLAAFLANSLGSGGVAPADLASPSPAIVLPLLSQALVTSVDQLRASVVATASALTTEVPPTARTAALFGTFVDIHSMAMLRETAMAVKQTAAFATAFHDKENSRDRSGKSGLGKEALAETRVLKTLSAQVLTDVKARIKAVKDALSTPGWLDWIANVVSPSKAGGSDDADSEALSRAVLDAVGGSAVIEDWAGHLLDGWRENIIGWGQVQLE